MQVAKDQSLEIVLELLRLEIWMLMLLVSMLDQYDWRS